MEAERDKDRRLLPRSKFQMPLLVNFTPSEQKWEAAWIINANRTGLLIELAHPTQSKPNDTFRLKLPICQDEEIDLGEGEIRFISPSSDNKILGIRFKADVPLFNGTLMLGISPQIRKIKSMLPTIGICHFNVLIRGETGTGKNILARLVHNICKSADAPFIRVNCPAIPDSLFESELFGHEKGAYTDAKASAPGYFRLAAEGTLVLDEISEIQPHLQAKLLNAIEERQFVPVGGQKSVQLKANLIATTNRNLEKAVEEGTFRRDLFYRLCELPFEIPPLRERPEDIPLLAHFFMTHYCQKFQRSPRLLSKNEIKTLKSHTWPGNVRELENYMKRSALLEDFIAPQDAPLEEQQVLDEDIEALTRHIMETLHQKPKSLPSLVKDISEMMEHFIIMQELVKCEQNRTLTAKHLGISYRTLLRKLEIIQDARTSQHPHN